MSIYFRPTRLYVKRHSGTGIRYFGKTTLNDIESYNGSGSYWSDHVQKHGKELVVTEWVSDYFNDPTELQDFALSFSELFDIVESKDWANLKPENGLDGFLPGTTSVYDTHNNNVILRVNVDDTNIKSGRFVSISKGTIPVKDRDGKMMKVSRDDERYLSGDLVHCTTGLIPVRDSSGFTKSVPADDPDFLSGKLVHVSKGFVTVRDTNTNNTFNVKSDDDRLKTGEVVPVKSGMITVRDSITNETRSIVVGSEEHLSGRYVGIRKGRVTVYDKNGNKFDTTKDDPRYLSGELSIKKYPCEHCGKMFDRGNLVKNHNDRCKYKDK